MPVVCMCLELRDGAEGRSSAYVAILSESQTVKKRLDKGKRAEDFGKVLISYKTVTKKCMVNQGHLARFSVCVCHLRWDPLAWCSFLLS